MIPDAFMTSYAERRLRMHGFNLDGKVRVGWNHDLKTTAGKVRCRTAEISIHPGLRAFPGETSLTLKHELAHLLAHLRAVAAGKSIKSHGREWRQACTDLGIHGEKATHNLRLRRIP